MSAMAIILFIVIPLFAFWIWMLVECLTKEADTGNTKIVWLLVLLLTHVIGAIIYYLVRRPQRVAELGR